MANINAPSGLSPVCYLNGAQYNGAGRVYHIPSTDNNAYAVGDPVIPNGTGDAAGVPGAILATAGTTNTVGGVVVSCAGASVYGGSYGVPQESPVVIPASKTRAYYILVADDPNIIFEIQEVGTGTQLAATDISLNCSLVSGANNGFVSGWMLDNSTKASTAALQLRLLQLAVKPNNTFGAYAKWWVLLNNHQFRTGVAGY
jgi:hypothetical protein